ncbi:SANT/Myb-like DNA-binding domain-containing protein [Rhodopirellula islandica]|nr:SANT/Myb-like DNA-binding domain-containing protein [Rhodopirellula islandica]
MSEKNHPNHRPIDASIDDANPNSDRDAAEGNALTRPGLPTAESDDSSDERAGDSGDSIFDQIRHCHPNPQAATELLDDLHFATLGLRTNESRLHIIRTATKRSAGALASVQVSKPSTINECHLARVITSAYRVMDPRYRIDRHQQVQLGRILPFELESVSCKSFSQETFFATTGQDSSLPNNVLIPHPPAALPTTPRGQLIDLAIEASDPQKIAEATTPPTNWVQTVEQSLLDDLPPRNEGEQVLEEMRAHRGRLKRWMSEVRTLIGLSVLCLAATFYLAYWLGARQANQSSTAINPTDRIASVEADAPASLTPELPAAESQLNNGAFTPEIAPAPTSVAMTPSGPAVAELAAESGNESSTTQSNVPLPDPQPAKVESDIVASVDVAALVETDPAAPGTETSEASMEMSPVSDAPDSDALASSSTTDTSPEIKSPSPVESRPPSEVVPPRREPRWTDAQISEATQELWDETERASRRFQLTEAAGLIDQWELIAELAGTGSLEHLAAMHLSLRASWLAEPFETTCQRAQDLAALTAAVTGSATPEPSDSATDTPFTWSEPMVRQLIESWRACRLTISTTEHLNHLLLRSNELLDQLILNNQNQWCSSFGFDAERLIAFTTDEQSRTELEDLLASVKTLPTGAELERMQQSDASAGVLGRTLCLHLRRWDKGVPLMCNASDSRLASVSKAEMQWREANNQPAAEDVNQTRAELGVRWSKIASHYGGRDAASIRLHALELLEGLEAYADQRAEILDLLPRYMTASLSKASATQSLSAPVRLSRLR